MNEANDDPQGEETLRAEAAAWLARLRGPCSPQDHAEFEDWYAADAKHAEAYDAVLSSWEASALAEATALGAGRRHRRSARRYMLAAAAASIVIALLAFGAYGAGFAGRDLTGPAGQASEMRIVELEDGSRATLASGSTLRAEFSESERRVVLTRGWARFAVAHAAGRPFVVAAGEGLVVARGTVFDVTLRDGQVEVVLLEGSVELRGPRIAGNNAPNAAQILTPGQGAVLQAGTIALHPSPVPGAMLAFDDALLGQVVAAANRHAASRIILAEPTLAQRRFTGSFEAGANRQLAGMIAEAFRLRQFQRDGDIVLAAAGAEHSGE